MWVVTVEDIDVSRDRLISDIIDDGEEHITKYVMYKGLGYSDTFDILEAKIWKTQVAVINFRDKVIDCNKKYINFTLYGGLFGKKLKIRKLSIQEWNRLIDLRVDELDEKYKSHRMNLLRQKK